MDLNSEIKSLTSRISEFKETARKLENKEDSSSSALLELVLEQLMIMHGDKKQKELELKKIKEKEAEPETVTQKKNIKKIMGEIPISKGKLTYENDKLETVIRLNPKQLQAVSDEYYVKGYMLGRTNLYAHMKRTHSELNFDSRNAIEGWLKYQEVNQLFEYQKKPIVVSSMVQRRPFHSISLDLIDRQNKPSMNIDPKNKNIIGLYHYILVIIDNFSRYMWTFPLETKQTKDAGAALTKFFEQLHDKAKWNLPKKDHLIKYIQMDNGSEFNKEFEAAIRKEDGKIKISKTIPYMPQSNSIVERSNGILKRILNKLIFVNGNQEWDRWSEFLPQATEIYNNKMVKSTNMIPSEAIELKEADEWDGVVDHIQKQSKVTPQPLQKTFAPFQRVRLRKPKGSLSKFDKENWTSDIYIITQINKQSKRSMDASMAKATKYFISKIRNENPLELYPEEKTPYLKQNLLRIPPLLKLIEPKIK